MSSSSHRAAFLPVLLATWVSALALSLLGAARAHAADTLDLPVVKPVISCEQLASAALSSPATGAVTIKTTITADTPKGAFCKVTGTAAPNIGFEVDLPIEHWTQRFAEGAMGRGTLNNAGACMPAVNGELVLAADDRGSAGFRDAGRGYGAQERIDWAYRGNHVTALVAKAIIKAFYGQAPRFSYFVGCSEGGRESLVEAQRYPDDFDGMTAGAPVAIDNVHNAFYHGWEAQANTRADGSIILASGRLAILHKAVIAHCAQVSGLIDDTLQEPTACQFDPAWVRCPEAAADTSACLTAEETAVVQKLYEGAGDGAGHVFEISGFPLGSEAQWKLSTSAGPADRESDPGPALRRLLNAPENQMDAVSLTRSFAFTQAWYDKMLAVAPLWNAANTNLLPFEKHGGKLILWHGAEDLVVQPAVSIAYYEGVQKQLGVKQTDEVMRFFLLPGVGHCGGGEGPAQIDVLSPLMAWVELKRAPQLLVAGKTAERDPMMGPPPGAAPGAGQPKVGMPPGAPGAVGPNGGGGPGGPPGPGGPGSQPQNPYSAPSQPTLYMRPVFAFPFVAHYSGHGDPNDAASYRPIRSGLQVPQLFNTEAARLFGPNNQVFYQDENGQLVAEISR